MIFIEREEPLTEEAVLQKLEILRQAAENKQVILFTCQGRESDHA